MKTNIKIMALAAMLCLNALPALAQQDQSSILNKVRWQRGPCSGALGEIAKIEVPSGYVFADGNDTRLLMEYLHNPTSGAEVGLIASTDSDWFVLFEFEETGYIKDDEKNSLDSGAMLKAITKGNEEVNKERIKRGWSPFKIIGWQQTPRYNSVTNNLEWAIQGESDGRQVINWNTRLLGRKGVMSVTLVTGPEQVQTTLPHYESLLGGFGYNPGNRYAEFQQGDKIAKYGLSALVVGGAAAAVAKSGLLKYLWKGFIVLVLAGAGFFKKLFGRKKEYRGQTSLDA
jgi:uncharacterized membrane-anchored protein